MKKLSVSIESNFRLSVLEEFEKYRLVHSDCVRWKALQFLLMHSIVYSVIVEKRVNCYQLAVMLLLERGQIIIRVLTGLVVVEDS